MAPGGGVLLTIETIKSQTFRVGHLIVPGGGVPPVSPPEFNTEGILDVTRDFLLLLFIKLTILFISYEWLLIFFSVCPQVPVLHVPLPGRDLLLLSRQ